MAFLRNRDLLMIRGKATVGHATAQEIASVFEHLDAIESKLDDSDGDDTFGTEGWRHWFGMPDE